MKHYHQLPLEPWEHPSFPRGIDGAEKPNSVCPVRTDLQRSDGLAPLALSGVDLEARHQIADALTAIMVQAEAARLNSLRLQAGSSQVISSCERINACAKRIWQLIAHQPDVGELSR